MKLRIAFGSAVFVFILGAILFPVIYALYPHHIDRHPSTSGPPINRRVKMLAKQDPSDARVVSITFINRSDQEVRLGNQLGGLVELFRFVITDAQRHEAPFTRLEKRIDNDYHTWHHVNEFQGVRIAPGNSITYRFNLTDLVNLSKLTGTQYTLTVTFTPLENYSGTVTAITAFKAPHGIFTTPPANVAQYPVR